MSGISEFDNICYIWFGIVMLKIYFAAKQAFVDDFSLQFIELLQRYLMAFIVSFQVSAPSI